MVPGATLPTVGLLCPGAFCRGGGWARLARVLGPGGFAAFGFASAVAAWLLVIVRGGVAVIVFREAARRPRLIHPLTELLLGLKCALSLVGYALVLAAAATVG